MSTTYNYWADQGANPEEFSCATIEGYTTEPCEHTEIYPNGECGDCGEEVEGFEYEPSDAEIFAHYGQTKTTGEAA